ncbi:PAS domain S-box protein [Terasakiella sp. A23]|uniref:PAS domain S-box protein n=1 Tax=Terasakiella sp. FCG-A23 TaxID=3080561 RepID=UPI00295360CD|nr:PAS domain S-box protein [Terasakiella sp. A23]MDV7340366.1 PAS domain S-box protein [Terasakiella sp. A23]
MLKIHQKGKSLVLAGVLGGALLGVISAFVHSVISGRLQLDLLDVIVFAVIGVIAGGIISYLICQNRALREELEERINLENDLSDSQKRLSLYLEKTPLAAISWDREFHCVGWNPAAEKIFGFSNQEAIGENPKNLIIHEDLHDRVDEIFNALLNQTGGSHSINENITKDGRRILCEWFNAPLIGEDGIPIGVSSFAQDITEIKNAENKLKESEEIFRRFYEIIPDVFMITSLNDGLCVDVNNGFCQTTGYAREEVIGKHTLDLHLWEKDEDRDKLVSGLKNDGILVNLASNFRKKDGSLWPGIMSACIVQKDGQPYILSSTKDVSDIRSSQLEAIEANRAKSEFLASMSHELRTPMNAILGFAQLLQYRTSEPLTDKQSAYVDLILKSGKHLLELIEQVLELSKIEARRMSLNFAQVEVGEVVEQTLSLIQTRAEKEGIQIIDQINSNDLPQVWTDSTRLKQVLLNLLSNAVKYNQQNGTVTLTCEVLHEDDLVRIKVQDTGPGIPEEKQDGLFKPFERLGLEAGHIEGTGIGLTITKQIIELLGGRIGFESDVGKGSVFWVDVPLRDRDVKV